MVVVKSIMLSLVTLHMYVSLLSAPDLNIQSVPTKVCYNEGETETEYSFSAEGLKDPSISFVFHNANANDSMNLDKYVCESINHTDFISFQRYEPLPRRPLKYSLSALTITFFNSVNTTHLYLEDECSIVNTNLYFYFENTDSQYITLYIILETKDFDVSKFTKFPMENTNTCFKQLEAETLSMKVDNLRFTKAS